MKITLSNETENPLMNRKVLKGDIAFEGATPGRYEMKLELAKELKLNPSLLILRRVINVFGDRKVIFEAHVYKSEAELAKVNKAILDKNKKPEPKESGEGQKPAEGKPQEAKPKKAAKKEAE